MVAFVKRVDRLSAIPLNSMLLFRSQDSFEIHDKMAISSLDYSTNEENYALC